MPNDDAKKSPSDEQSKQPLSLPIVDMVFAPPEPWGVPEIEPSTLLAAIETEQPPTAEEAEHCLRAIAGDKIEVLGDAEVATEFATWSRAVRLQGHDVPLVIWVERIREEAIEHIPPYAIKTRWLLGVQTALDPSAPMQSWTWLAQLLGVIHPELCAMFDVETGQWFPHEEFHDRLMGDDASPEESMLFRLHATASEPEPERAESVWLRTVGLHRCGRPEIEVLEVQGLHVGVVQQLLEAVAALSIVRGCPPPDASFDLGVGIELSLRAWEPQAEQLSPKSIGNHEHRLSLGGANEDCNALLHGRAILCAAVPVIEGSNLYSWPQEAAERLERGEAALERTTAWSKARALEAQKGWDVLLEGHKAGRLARVCVALETTGGGREHVWLALEIAEQGRLVGRLLSTPADLQIESGAPVEFTREQVIDWALMRGE
jgi:uncharacterized protein YegJ (DUF2314 family)